MSIETHTAKKMVDIGSDVSIDHKLVEFVDTQVLPGLTLSKEVFWSGVADIFIRFSPRNQALLKTRERLQSQINDWLAEHPGKFTDGETYKEFLSKIGYLVDEPAGFEIDTQNVDDELSVLAGPQLVVPVLNDRYVLNAANARWGSLYDALYGTDVLPQDDGSVVSGYDPKRGEKVIAWAKNFLDTYFPLETGSHGDVDGYQIIKGELRPALKSRGQFAGYVGEDNVPTNILLRHNGLHIDLIVDRSHPVGKQDRAGLKDIVLESALSTIVDFEDSVAAVDAEDKIVGYRNWLGLMKEDLAASFQKGGRTTKRVLAEDRLYYAADGSEFKLKGRSLLLVRNVGHLMTTPAVTLPGGGEAPEGILDAVITSLIACHDLKVRGNSQRGSIYIVKPKMHGPEECTFTNELFDAVEDLLKLDRHTIKVGVMDEERRTSANLAACIHAVKSRIAFINTGFLDRTGDEMHTSMLAGPMVRKGDMKQESWIGAYEERNVSIGLKCGFASRAQIGKGMWAAPDRMADMLDQKAGHPKTGANTAWVPSPTAATLHAVHYHEVDVAAIQQEMSLAETPSLDALLALPVSNTATWTTEEIEREIDNNVQGILGYVVRWIDQGVGCSKVPDINDIGLMEDRATLRISSQHVANWLMHKVCTVEQVEASFRKMAAKVDMQNAGDSLYQAMSPSFNGIAYRAAQALVYQGAKQPNGYTEPLLHAFRAEVKGH